MQRQNKTPPKDHEQFEITGYRPEYDRKYRELNYEWLQKYFEIESTDEKVLSNPKKEIIDKKGFIFFALFKGEVIGTCTLIRHDDETYEVSKMCVTEHYQKKGAGERLINEAISKAYQLGLDHLYLSTSRRLTAAINLYKKKGFKIISKPPNINASYKRESIHMRFTLNHPRAHHE
jgi:N-acetylglutamate synthase-like GNAT family acetyltransferase